MSDQSQTNGAAPPASAEQPQNQPPPSLREIAEAAYDEVLDDAASPGEPGQLDDGGQPRDAHGRFAPKDAKPGEQSTDPAPKENSEASSDAKPTDPAPRDGSSNQPPQHWSEQDRQAFAKLPAEGRPSSSGGTPRWSGTTRRRRRRRRQQSSSRSRWHRSSRTRSWSGRCSRPGSLRSKRSVSGQGSTAGPWTPTFRSGSSCTRSSASAWVWTQRQAARAGRDQQANSPRKTSRTRLSVSSPTTSARL